MVPNQYFYIVFFFVFFFVDNFALSFQLEVLIWFITLNVESKQFPSGRTFSHLVLALFYRGKDAVRFVKRNETNLV